MKYVVITIKEPFPIFYGYGPNKGKLRHQATGPFYKAGSKFFRLYTSRELEFARHQANLISQDGYTVRVTLEDRNTASCPSEVSRTVTRDI